MDLAYPHVAVDVPYYPPELVEGRRRPCVGAWSEFRFKMTSVTQLELGQQLSTKRGLGCAEAL